VDRRNIFQRQLFSGAASRMVSSPLAKTSSLMRTKHVDP
jgi:hypothetical protein